MLTPERWQRVRDVLEQAMELAPEKRSRFLDVACSSDPSLRSEVQSLLSADARARSSFLESPPLQSATLATGTKLGDYEIVSQIGSGGMGVVYRARDLRLDREVAIKVLPVHLSSDTARLKRFEQEAKSAAALNHPNILAVYQLGTFEGAPYLVSELLEGQTVRDVMKAGPLSQPRLRDYAEQIADGLAAAHERGIIHRDLKPENLFVTKDNRVKILDFGLAKLVQGESESPETVATLGLQTHPGMIAGTVGYMSPEQVRGEKLDTRTDLFSFGVVLYEMATGKRPFEGDTSGVTFEAILNRQPIPPTKLNAKVAPGLENMIAKALEKDRDIRYQHASDIRADLKRLKRDSESGHTDARITPGKTKPSILRWLIPIAGVLLLGSGLLLYKRPWAKPIPKKLLLERELTANRGENWVLDAIISRDGKQLLYAEPVSGLTLQQIDTGEKRTFPNSKNMAPQSWYPDGTHVLLAGFNENPGFWKLSTVDASLRKVSEFGEEVSGRLSPNGAQIIFQKRSKLGELWAMGSEGENPHVLIAVTPDQIEVYAWAPDSLRIAYGRTTKSPGTPGKDYVLETCNANGGDVQRIIANEGYPGDLNWLPDGRITYRLSEPEPNYGSTNLWAIRVEPTTGRSLSQPSRITSGIGFLQGKFSSSDDGKRLCFLRIRPLQNKSQIAEMLTDDKLGAPRQLIKDAWEVNPHGWTRDGRAIYFTSNQQGHWGLYTQDLQTGDTQLVVSLPEGYHGAVITPDQKWLLYTEGRNENLPRLMRMPLSGGVATPILEGSFSYDCSLAANVCVLMETDKNQHNFYLLDPMKGRGQTLMQTNEPILDWDWKLSPDAKSVALHHAWIASKIEILQQDGIHEVPIKWKGASFYGVTWGADSKHLYAVADFAQYQPNRILSVNLDGNFKVVFEAPEGEQSAYLDVSPDGRHLFYTTDRYEQNVILLENF